MARPMQGFQECPVCHQQTAVYDGHSGANICTRRSCPFFERVERPQMMTKWDIIDLIEKDPDVQDAFLGVADRKIGELWKRAQQEADKGIEGGE